jgi:hypothetical protein
MTEVTVEYSPDFWQKIAYKERTRADDNMRLAAERATTIQELSEALRDAKEEIEHLRATYALKVCPTCKELTDQKKVCEVWHCMKCYQAADHGVTKLEEK